MENRGPYQATAVLFLAFLFLPAFSAVAASPALPLPVPCNASAGSCYVPHIGEQWQWQLSCTPGLPSCTRIADRPAGIGFYDIDWEENRKATVARIHRNGSAAIAYISAGTWENWRGDRGSFPLPVIGNIYGEWPDERWLDVRRTDVLIPLMVRRMKIAKNKGFDGVQFDNLDGWQADTGFPLTAADYTYYAARLSNKAHKLGLSAAWENALEIRRPLLPYMDWFLMEDCHVYGECRAARAFTGSGKFVGGVEYTDETTGMGFCSFYDDWQISGLLKNRNLGAWRKSCPQPGTCPSCR
ncbi:MAG: endo alpha-1,4 polygalactosaminidase [Methanoregulaceae archaeon]|nr:endo alpha-1,4 polygalactosaminidase [Methanoregulaceae archaeon]